MCSDIIESVVHSGIVLLSKKVQRCVVMNVRMLFIILHDFDMAYDFEVS